MGELRNFAIKNSQYLKILAGEEVVLTYKGFKVVPNMFDADKDSIRYTFEQDGTVKYWTNSSGSVAMQFDSISEGSLVTLKKETDSSGRNKYTVKKVS